MLTGLALEGQRRPGVPGVLASRIPTKIQKPMPYATSSSKTANLKIVQKQLLFGLRLLFLNLCCLRCVVGCFLHGTSSGTLAASSRENRCCPTPKRNASAQQRISLDRLAAVSSGLASAGGAARGQNVKKLGFGCGFDSLCPFALNNEP